MKTIIMASAIAAGLGVAAFIGYSAASPSKATDSTSLVEHGRYVVLTAGCNDCHTAGYAFAAGNIDEKVWLMGDALGWQGPWGTTYAVNLRLFMHGLTEDQWVTVARTLKSRPPMPFFNVNAMTDRDLRAIYQFTRSLGPAGEPAPAYLPPGTAAPLPVVEFKLPPPPDTSTPTAASAAE